MFKWIGVIAVLIAALLLSAVMLQEMGLFDVKQYAMDRLETIPAVADAMDLYRLGLRAEEALQEERNTIEALQTELEDTRRAMENQRQEIERLYESLARREAELDQRERQLDARAETLNAQAMRFQDLERLQAIYDTMRPKELAPIVEALEDNVIAHLFAGMSERQVAAVLAEIEPDRAARISKLMGGISSK